MYDFDDSIGIAGFGMALGLAEEIALSETESMLDYAPEKSTAEEFDITSVDEEELDNDPEYISLKTSDVTATFEAAAQHVEADLKDDIKSPDFTEKTDWRSVF